MCAVSFSLIIVICLAGCIQFLISISLSYISRSSVVIAHYSAASSILMFIGLSPVMIHSLSIETVRYALAILMFSSLCILTSLLLLLALCTTSFQTGAPYSSSGSITPVYIVLSALCFRPHDNFADFASENISFGRFSSM